MGGIRPRANQEQLSMWLRSSVDPMGRSCLSGRDPGLSQSGVALGRGGVWSRANQGWLSAASRSGLEPIRNDFLLGRDPALSQSGVALCWGGIRP